MINPFRRLQGIHTRIACQVLHVDRDEDGTLIDLVTLAPFDVNGEGVAPGTLFTLGFTADEPDAEDELNRSMRRWEQACSVLDVGVDQAPDGCRYEFATRHHVLVLTVDDPPEWLTP